MTRLERLRWPVALALVLLVGAIVRLPRITADLPTEVEVTGSPFQDAYWYLEPAACAVDGSQLESYPNWDRPLWAAIGTAWFRVLGTSVRSVHLLGAAFSLLGVACVYLIAYRAFGKLPAIFCGLALALGYPFVALGGRTAVIYGPIAGILALVSLLWLLAVDARLPTGRRVACGLSALVVLLATALWFKLVSMVLVPALAVTLAVSFGRSGLRVLGALAIVAVACTLVLFAFSPGDAWSANKDRVLKYLCQPSEGLPLGLVRRLAFLGGSMAFLPCDDPLQRWIGMAIFPLTPVLIALAIAGVMAAWFDRDRLPPEGRAALVLAAVWLTAWAVASVPLDYRPMRFGLLTGPPLALLGGYVVSRLEGVVSLSPARAPGRLERWVDAVVALALVFVLTTHVFGWVRDSFAPAIGQGNERWRQDRELMIAGLVVALGAAVVAFRRRGGETRPHRTLSLVVACLFIGLDGGRDLRALKNPETLLRAAGVTRRILDPTAVVAGPYASCLTIGTPMERRRGTTTIMTGPGTFESIARVQSLGYTHVTLDLKMVELAKFIEHWGQAGAPPRLVAIVSVGQFPCAIFRFHGAEHRGYPPSTWEMARILEDRGDIAGAEKLYGKLDAALTAARFRTLFYLGRQRLALKILAEAPQDDPEIVFLKTTQGLPAPR